MTRNQVSALIKSFKGKRTREISELSSLTYDAIQETKPKFDDLKEVVIVEIKEYKFQLNLFSSNYYNITKGQSVLYDGWGLIELKGDLHKIFRILGETIDLQNKI